MTGQRRKPALDPEDERLWRYATRNVQPLGPGHQKERAESLTPARPALKPSRVNLSLPPQPLPPPPNPRTEPLEGPANRQWARRMGRGDMAIDARLDLHGLTQAAAHTRLMRFLAQAAARDQRVLLVITGKGKSGEGERGILRRALPMWLRDSAVSNRILSVSAAHPRHGGAGAFYVILRRQRDG